MTKTMSKEWGRYKVCVNCVAFGFIETRLTKPLDDPESKIVIEGKEVHAGVPQAALSALPTMVPLWRAGTAEEAAGGVYLFCIPESNYVSGQTLIVGGGPNGRAHDCTPVTHAQLVCSPLLVQKKNK